MLTDPVKNRYLIGLGLGIIIGAAGASDNEFPTFLVIVGVAFGVVGVILSYFEGRNGKKRD